jgi:lipoate-protein ligase A
MSFAGRSPLARADVVERMVESFAGRCGLEPGSGPATVELAEDRVTTRFGTDSWLTGVP